MKAMDDESELTEFTDEGNALLGDDDPDAGYGGR